MTNPRRGKRIVKVWLTESEIKGLNQALKDIPANYINQTIADIIREANRRGDINGN